MYALIDSDALLWWVQAGARTYPPGSPHMARWEREGVSYLYRVYERLMDLKLVVLYCSKTTLNWYCHVLKHAKKPASVMSEGNYI